MSYSPSSELVRFNAITALKRTDQRSNSELGAHRPARARKDAPVVVNRGRMVSRASYPFLKALPAPGRPKQ